LKFSAAVVPSILALYHFPSSHNATQQQQQQQQQ